MTTTAAPYTTFPTTPTRTLTPKPFTISIPDSALSELKAALHASKIAPPTYESLPQHDRRYGVSREWMLNAKKYWEEEFDWRARERYMNTFPHYTAAVVDDDGTTYDVHFVALLSSRKDAVPLAMLHGWPGSFLEFLPILSLLKERYTPDELPYNVIVPSLPGYTLSSGPPLDRDFGVGDMARVLDRLMVGLGFGAGYVVQGGDIGSRIGRVLGAWYDSCKAVHFNFMHMPEPAGIDPASVNDAEQEGVRRCERFNNLGRAYAFEHGTRTSTIGLVLSSNPVALLAWIGEKFLEWTDQDPSLETIVESVMLYWVTDTIARCLYPYRDAYKPERIGLHDNPKAYISKPIGYSWFPKELAPIPKSWVATTGNLVFHRQHTEGGHFAALERPDALLRDVEEFVKQTWPSK